MANAKVLIVEHKPLVAQRIAERLEATGYTVCASVACEARAVEKAEEMSPDIALIDAENSNGDWGAFRSWRRYIVNSISQSCV